MPFANYSDLIEEVASLLARSDVRPKIPGWIRLAELDAVTRIRNLGEVLYKTSGTLTADVATLTLPVGLSRIELFELDLSPKQKLTSVTLDELGDKRALVEGTVVGDPWYYALTVAGVVELQPVPDDTTAYTIYWKGAPPDLNESKLTSQILEQAPQVLLYGAAIHSALWLRDPVMLSAAQGVHGEAVKLYGKFLARQQQQLQAPPYQGPPGDRPIWAY